MIGESGAGKSTLGNALLGEQRLRTGEVRGGDAKGRHTTTTRELVALPGGGALIDTPGLRGLGVWPTSEGLARAFPEVGELAAGCRFPDCRHEAEPGCAVLAAVERGELGAARYGSWLRLRTELEDVEEAQVEQVRRRRGRPRRPPTA